MKLVYSITRTEPHQILSPSRSPPVTHGSSFSLSPLASSLTRSFFHSELKTWLFGKSFPPQTSLPTGLILRTLYPFNVFYSAQRLDLFAQCVRLSRLSVGFRTHSKSLQFHSFIQTLTCMDAVVRLFLLESKLR